MGVPVRPAKPIGGGGGTSWIPGPDLMANELEADIVELYNVLTGNIDVTNMKALAGLLGSMLADAPSGITTAKINDKAVTDAKIANDGANDALRAIGINHIKTDSVDSRILKLSTYSHAASIGPIVAEGSDLADTGLSTTGTIQPLIAYLAVAGTAVAGFVALTVVKDTVSNTWKIIVQNTHETLGPNITINANELKLLYVD